jgi:hypothetical protein
VKMKLTSTLIAIGWFGLCSNMQAFAQYAQQYAPSRVVAHSSPNPSGSTRAALLARSAEPIQTPTGTIMKDSQSPQPTGGTVTGDTIALTTENQAVDSGFWNDESQGPCCSVCGGGKDCPPDWYIEQNVRILSRGRPRDMGVGFGFTEETNTMIGDEVLNTRSASPDISGIWGMKIGHYFARDSLNRDHFVEFSFWGLNNWRDEASANGVRISTTDSDGNTNVHGNLYSGYSAYTVLNSSSSPVWIWNGIIVPGFDRADRQTTYYSSSTNNFEINGRITPRDSRDDRLVMDPSGRWKRECQPGQYMSYLYGLRFLQLAETFRFHSEGITDVFNSEGVMIDSKSYTGDYDVVAHNNLLGLQIGADMMFRQCRWEWGVRTKIGAYVNFSDQVSNISSGIAMAPDFVERLSASKHEASFIGELGFTTTYKFRPNLMGRASYDFMWVSGLALAPEQLQFTTAPTNRINTNGLAFFQGITLGLEWLW